MKTLQLRQESAPAGQGARKQPGTALNGSVRHETLTQELIAASAQVGQMQALQRRLDGSPRVMQQLARMPGSTAPVQRYAIGTGATRNVTVTGANGSKTFEECTSNWVKYNAGDAMSTDGSTTKSPAAWANWLVNKKGGRNATQLHVVNARWGGPGGQDDKNIVPGTPAENSHHLHEGEKKFDADCFSDTKTAQETATYTCTATPSYGNAIDVSGGSKDFADPTLTVSITTGAGTKTANITPGSEGLTFKDGS
ncbi:MAG TPA: hypothetical protein VIF60_23790 [Burkholderiaceae bacterium]|jgi:hypothetical protein